MNSYPPPLLEETCDLLNQSAGDVFGTMFNLPLRPTAPADFHRRDGLMIAASVGLVGEATGMICIFVRVPFGRELARKFLCLSAGAVVADEMVNDVIGELCNMIVGAVKSRLCDSGRPCVLTMPSFMRGSNLSAVFGADSGRALSFACLSEPVWIELIMKQPH